MAEDDEHGEVDILGDFDVDKFMRKTDPDLFRDQNASLMSPNSDELLGCEYTIHPQWLLDRPSTNPDNWYNSSPILSSDLTESFGLVSSENYVSDGSGWTEKEKNLLKRGIEIFGKSNLRLSQFIGSRTSSEVRYYLKHFYIELPVNYAGINNGLIEETNGGSNLVSDVLDDTQIPASVEEVIASVSTAETTVQTNRHKRSNSTNSYDDSNENSSKNTPETSSEQILETFETNSPELFESNSNGVKFKVKTKLKFPMQHVKVKKKRPVKKMNQKIKKDEVGKVQITTGKGLSVPVYAGEQIVKIQKHDSDSNSDIDIEDSDESKSEELEEPASEVKPIKPVIIDSNSKSIEVKQKPYIDLSTLNEYIVKQLTSMEEPQSEVTVNENFVSDLEKVIHCEFFEGRPTKTPLRYLKIRNHIINAWLASKPSYVTKTSIRQGLKSCGDVNCISRVHCYLEQTGVINFGCSQVTYVRPLLDLFQQLAPTSREKVKNVQAPNAHMGSRLRVKRKLKQDGEGGYTLAHDEKGDVISTTIVSEDRPKPKGGMRRIGPGVSLRFCEPFPEKSPKKFVARIHLTTLLALDFHAHTSFTEVMGLVGGCWDREERILTITHYEPCQNIASSTTHCDMCPISQFKAGEIIRKRGLSILGWFHSHPTFAPEPSQQDLDTQENVQKWVGRDNECVGVILTPFSSHGALIASPWRCMVVHKKENCKEELVPYKLEVEIVTDEFNIEQYFGDLKRIMAAPLGVKERKVNFRKPYFQNSSLSYLEKYVTSVRMRLAKCGTLNKTTCEYIVESIMKICSK